MVILLPLIILGSAVGTIAGLTLLYRRTMRPFSPPESDDPAPPEDSSTDEPQHMAFRRAWITELVGHFFTPAEIDALVQDVRGVNKQEVQKIAKAGVPKKLVRRILL